MTKELLPPNSTQLEKDVLDATSSFTALSVRADAIADAKHNTIPLSYIPWLISEYGIGRLTDWLTDERLALKEGVLFNRLIGTKKAIVTALGWIGFTPDTIEKGVYGQFYNVQLDTGRVPTQDLIDNIVNLVREALSTRDRLIRLYHGLDYPPMQLCVTKLNESVLSNFSGIFDESNDVWLSFMVDDIHEATPELEFTASAITIYEKTNEAYLCSQTIQLNTGPGNCDFGNATSSSFEFNGKSASLPSEIWTEVIPPDKILSGETFIASQGSFE